MTTSKTVNVCRGKTLNWKIEKEKFIPIEDGSVCGVYLKDYNL